MITHLSNRSTPVLWRLIQYLRPFWGRMALGITAMTGVMVVGLIPPLLIRELVDRICRTGTSMETWPHWWRCWCWCRL